MGTTHRPSVTEKHSISTAAGFRRSMCRQGRPESGTLLHPTGQRTRPLPVSNDGCGLRPCRPGDPEVPDQESLQHLIRAVRVETYFTQVQHYMSDRLRTTACRHLENGFRRPEPRHRRQGRGGYSFATSRWGLRVTTATGICRSYSNMGGTNHHQQRYPGRGYPERPVRLSIYHHKFTRAVAA